ncbi:MAG: amidohydrolase family protein [Pseudomonadota bacterium]|nr:amidohydrolase family protein [Pseudomonadota bacterium]
MEMATYVVDSGLTPMEALMTGTVNAARAGGIKNVGSLEPGMAADVIAMAQSPLDDIHAVMGVSFVMRGGIVSRAVGPAK